LVTASAYNVDTVLIFNKIDIYDQDEKALLEYYKEVYGTIGYKTIETSAIKNFNIDKIKEMMKGKVSMFAGHSGVGKSTLINSIEQGLELKTEQVSDSHNKGQHTTTFAEMYQLSFGADIIDTPGIKGFGLVDMDKEEIGDYFPEILKHKSNCKFNNCLHENEPKCAVKDAVKDGLIEEFRYYSYLSLLHGDEGAYRIDDYN
jgi:ribosome biogenesis GTPase / thiamine phosphate phosphatase